MVTVWWHSLIHSFILPCWRQICKVGGKPAFIEHLLICWQGADSWLYFMTGSCCDQQRSISLVQCWPCEMIWGWQPPSHRDMTAVWHHHTTYSSHLCGDIDVKAPVGALVTGGHSPFPHTGTLDNATLARWFLDYSLYHDIAVYFSVWTHLLQMVSIRFGSNIVHNMSTASLFCTISLTCDLTSYFTHHALGVLLYTVCVDHTSRWVSDHTV